ncbi:MAG: bifunctional metallophosphatase/5'-nucleotidase [Shewanella sp.]|nr:bifunctional metallophosphatase/5'-nucleotidase [Shewanella sp.]MCF1431803.1 bifunctional metallophosphatase/5'-nucleotidase [Shewanella sp.]MCF1438382.1 bifunctional metallophosphatase/5'-nucleotidase [Shewanella sp.]MCF1456837.1 bifunctional metallophosphatase/5'-nucleotidase [Shewanella sp.]
MTPRLLLKLAHINDTHSHFEPSRVRFTLPTDNEPLSVYAFSGGYARIQTLLREARQQARQCHQDFLFLHGGDSFQGSLYFREFKGAANADMLNRLNPDAMVLGNHEIDGGNAPVRRFLDAITFPLMAGNMDLSSEAESELALKDHPRMLDYDRQTHTARVLLKPLGDRQLALFGITLEQMQEIAHPDPSTEFHSAIDVTRRTIAQLHRQGIKHILVLSHLGLDGDRILAQAVDGISLIVGGHSHTLQGSSHTLGKPALPYGERVNNTPIVHAGKYAETLGLADIEFALSGEVTSLCGQNLFMLDDRLQDSNGQPLSAKQYSDVNKRLAVNAAIRYVPDDDELANLLATRYRPKIDELERQIVTLVPWDMQHTRLPSKRLPHGSELAPWVSRAMYSRAKLQNKRIDFALHNAGGVRDSLSHGQLTVADVLGKVLPFDLPLVAYQIRGRFLYAAIESAINAATNNGIQGTGTGSFPYTYGLRYEYDGRRPAGQRIVSLEVMQQKAWRILEFEQLYIGVSSQYTISGKEGYGPLLNSEWRQFMDSLTLPGAFMEYVRSGDVWADPVSPNVHYTSHLILE